MSKGLKRNQVLAGLDIGTTKVTCTIGSIGEDGINIIGVGHSPNTGMRQGVVVNIEAVSEAIIKAKEEAELMAGVPMPAAWLAIGGAHIESFDSQGMVAIKNKEVSNEDIERVIEAAKAVRIANDRQVLHVLPKEFKIDSQEGINDPIGMSGVRLECSVHIVTGSNSAVQNAIRCADRAGLQVEGLVLEQFASALAVLSTDEKNLGVTVVDMGGGTCDLITFAQGSVIHTNVIPVGGNNFTHDVAMGLRTTQNNAEILKKKFGCALPDMVNEEDAMEVESVGGRQSRTISRKDLCEVLEARADETLKLIREDLESSDLMKDLGSGIVLTGGASQLQGLVEMGDFVFDVPVRKGVPERTGGLTDVVKSPAYSTCVGLMKYGMTRQRETKSIAPAKGSVGNVFSNWAHRIKELFG